jgi:type IV secretory pathway VirJ component
MVLKRDSLKKRPIGVGLKFPGGRGHDSRNSDMPGPPSGQKRMRIRVLIAAVSLVFAASAFAAREESFRFSPFGTVTAYYDSLDVSKVVLFISGDGGWNEGVVDMAREAARAGALVVGIDIRSYLGEISASKEPCFYPAGDLEELSQFVQKKYAFKTYLPPVLIGYSSGATLVYAALVQAPETTFRGGISLGFCPDLVLKKPLCRGSGLEWTLGKKSGEYIYLPSGTLNVPWIVLQGQIDQVCDPPSTANFVKQVPRGKVIDLPKVGHGFAVAKNWVPQFHEALGMAFDEAAPEPAPVAPVALKDLPLIEVPSSGDGGSLLAVHLTGAGGWGVTDEGVAEGLSAKGIPVVGLSSLKYFWTRRTPDSAAEDLGRVLRYYFREWNKKEALIIGYSFGADVLPFIYNRLPDDLKAGIRLLVLMGPSDAANFELHFANLLGKDSWKDDVPTLPEIEKIKNVAVICFYGTEDAANISDRLALKGIRTIPIQSGHRFGRNYGAIVETILKELSLDDARRGGRRPWAE